MSNTATADAGGLYVEGGELTLTGGTIRGNAAGTGGKGGGFHLKNSAGSIVSADIYSNTAYTGAGLYVEGPAVFNPPWAIPGSSTHRAARPRSTI